MLYHYGLGFDMLAAKVVCIENKILTLNSSLARQDKKNVVIMPQYLTYMPSILACGLYAFSHSPQTFDYINF